MDDLRQRLAQCFSLAFPGLKAPEVYSASTASVAAWDSTAAIILANVIEEEFRVKLDYAVLPELISFELMLQHLKLDQSQTHIKSGNGIS